MANFDFNMSVNIRAVFCFIQNCVPHLKESNDSSIVNVSSVNGIQSFGGCMSYCASKAACDMIMRCASVDLAPYGIRVNNVNPGVVITKLQKRGGLSDEQYEAFVQRSTEAYTSFIGILRTLCATGRSCRMHFVPCKRQG